MGVLRAGAGAATLLLLGSAACGPAPSADGTGTDATCEAGCTTSGGDDDGDGGDDDDDGGSGADGADGADDGGNEGPVDDGGDTGPSGAGLPCDVRDALATHCWSCHGDAPMFGAPMALTTWEDFQVPAATDPTRSVYELVPERVGNAANPMPPSGQIEPVDAGTLVQWATSGATPSMEDCGDPPEPPDEPEVGPDALPCEPSHTFIAHAQGSTTDPFHVPVIDNLYECFTFQAPLSTTTQITAWAPIVDDERVLHHWILYRVDQPQPDNGVGPCNLPGDATFIAGWAPGGANFVMPDDVGLEFGDANSHFVLQMHYNNVAGHLDALDMSGVAVCSTETPRPQTAGIIWLGTFNINIPVGAVNHEVSGVCPSLATSLLPGPLNIMASFPHMHQLGRRLRTDIHRGGPGGPQELLVDANPFSFDNQAMYPHSPPVVLNPGDELVTRCTYENTYGFPVSFGENTEDEMCFNFIMTYPIQGIPDAYRECTL